MQKLLFIDDSKLLRNTTKLFLSMNNFEVVTAEDGVDAMEKLETSGPFDIVVSDLEMPKMDGIALVRNIRTSDADYAHIPIVIRTTAKDKIHDAVRAGASGWVLKQSEDESEELLKAIKKLI